MHTTEMGFLQRSPGYETDRDRRPLQRVQPHGGPYLSSTPLTCSYRGHSAARTPRPWPPQALHTVSTGFRLSPALVLISRGGEMPCSCPGQIREMDKGGGRGEASTWVAWLAFSESTCFAETCSLTLPSPRPQQAGSERAGVWDDF